MVRPPHTFDGGDDAVIGAAAADVAVHMGDDLCAGWLGILLQQSRCLHDLTRLAIAALGNLLGNPGLLQRVARVRRQAFDGGDLLAAEIRHLHAARAGRFAVDMHGAGAALGDAAPELCPGELEMLTQHPEEWGIGLCLDGDRLAIDRNCCGDHARLRKCRRAGEGRTTTLLRQRIASTMSEISPSGPTRRRGCACENPPRSLEAIVQASGLLSVLM